MPARNLLYDNILNGIARSPGVVAVGAALMVPTRGRVSTTLRIEGELADEARLPDLGYVSIRGNYFEAMRIPLLAGREYNESIHRMD